MEQGKRVTDRLKIQSYCGETLRSDSNPPQAIIENFLWTEDAAMLLGSEKAGKSINAQQMFVDIVCGNPYLGQFKVLKQGPVVYLQCEGKRDEFVARLNNMLITYDNFDDSKFLHIFKKYCPLNNQMFMEAIFQIIDTQVKVWGCNPVAICIDSVYKAIDGDLNENRDIIGFTNSVDDLISRYKCAVLLIHHESKEWHDEKHNTIDRGDKGTYGSVFLRAYVDHILYLKMKKDKTRTLSCDTHRSGSINEGVLDLILIEPQPLLFQIKGDYRASTEVILHQLKLHGALTYAMMVANTGLALITIKQATSVLLKDRKISFTDSKEREFFVKS